MFLCTSSLSALTGHVQDVGEMCAGEAVKGSGVKEVAWMSEPCPKCGSNKTRAGRRIRLYASRHGPVIAPGCLSMVLLAVGCALFAAGEWLLPTSRPYLFVVGAVAVLAPLAIPFYYLRYRRTIRRRRRCLSCGYRWLA